MQNWIIAILIIALIGLGSLFLIQNANDVQLPNDEDNGDTPTDEQPDDPSLVNLIRVTNLEPEDTIESPLVIEGVARGTWYFEATFPVVLVNWDGLIIAETYAEAQSDWMTEEFVPFKATVTFETPDYGERGAIILQKSNPSGLPEHDNALEIPIRFAQ